MRRRMYRHGHVQLLMVVVRVRSTSLVLVGAGKTTVATSMEWTGERLEAELEGARVLALWRQGREARAGDKGGR